MNKKIVYIKENGGIAIISPCPSAKKSDESWENFYERIRKRDVPFGARSSIMEQMELPGDREYRKLWELELWDKYGSVKQRAPKI